MPMRHAFAASVLIAVSATAAWAAPVRKAGEWQTVINGGQPIVTCMPEDMPVDEKSITQSMSKIPGADCKMNNFTPSGDTIDYVMECMIGGSKMTATGKITQTGPDAFTSRSHSHGGNMPTPGGQTMPLPDMDTTVAFNRTGPCKPGDQQIKK
ncbi:MAG: DUF3617 family protein [Proteobacteria bacterium]|nr:DUF3617 family protein [Pseudomonadota bacterium]